MTVKDAKDEAIAIPERAFLMNVPGNLVTFNFTNWKQTIIAGAKRAAGTNLNDKSVSQ